MKDVYLVLGSVVLALIILFVAFGPEPEINFGKRGTMEEGVSGIMGEVRLGPTCPAEPRAEPGSGECGDKLFSTKLFLLDVTGLNVVREFESGADGRFKISVPPGEYFIRRTPAGDELPTCGGTGLVPVELNEYADVIVFCDTGIR